MTSITALLHTQNDALRLGRALETLYACDQVLIIDHGSSDATLRVARNYGAKVLSATTAFASQDYLRAAPNGWILSLDPCESLTEKLAASLFEWKSESFHPRASAFSVFLREETEQGWMEVPIAQTRLVPHHWKSWKGKHPMHEPSAPTLEGELLRFVFP
jgi:glycosyltransferase involved in cell wall biosynthesis